MRRIKKQCSDSLNLHTVGLIDYSFSTLIFFFFVFSPSFNFSSSGLFFFFLHERGFGPLAFRFRWRPVAVSPNSCLRSWRTFSNSLLAKAPPLSANCLLCSEGCVVRRWGRELY